MQLPKGGGGGRALLCMHAYSQIVRTPLHACYCIHSNYNRLILHLYMPSQILHFLWARFYYSALVSPKKGKCPESPITAYGPIWTTVWNTLIVELRMRVSAGPTTKNCATMHMYAGYCSNAIYTFCSNHCNNGPSFNMHPCMCIQVQLEYCIGCWMDALHIQWDLYWRTPPKYRNFFKQDTIALPHSKSLTLTCVHLNPPK